MFDWHFNGKVDPVVTEKYETVYEDESKSLAHLEYSSNQISEAKIGMSDFLIQH